MTDQRRFGYFKLRVSQIGKKVRCTHTHETEPMTAMSVQAAATRRDKPMKLFKIRFPASTVLLKYVGAMRHGRGTRSITFPPYFR